LEEQTSKTSEDFADLDVERLFGSEAAEDESADRLAEYFLKTEVWHSTTDLRRNLRIVVGKKGTGKSAIFRIASREDEANGRLSIIVQPDDFHEIAIGEGDHLKLVRAWRKGLNQVILSKALQSLSKGDPSAEGKGFKAAGKILDVISRAVEGKLKGFSLDPARQELAESFAAKRELTVYIDDLDRGWIGSQDDVRRLAAMFDAIRDLLRDNDTVRCRIALRSDVYTLLRTDPASDKFEASAVHQSWSNHEVFVLLIKRIETFFGREVDSERLLNLRQRELAGFLDPIVERRFHGAGKWSDTQTYHVILSFARRRPRDLVKLLTFAAREAQRQKHSRILTADLQGVFPQFSDGRLQDVVNEFKAELPALRDILLAMKPSKQERAAVDSYVLSTEQMVRKLQNVLGGVSARFTDGRQMTPVNLLAFLYKIDFLQARKDDGDEIQRVYFDENSRITPDQVDVGFKWEIHLAFRWVLQPDRPEDIYRFTDPELSEAG